MKMLQTTQTTISSVELVEIINSLREEGAAELLHKNFLAKIENHPGIQSAKFSADYKDHTNAIKQHCKGVAKHHPLQTAGGVQEVRVLIKPDAHS